MDLPIHIIDKPGLSPLAIRSQVRRLKARHNIGLVIIDYLQLARQKGAKSREQEISQIAQGLKAIAKEMYLPVIALAQLNRKVEERPNKRPQLADLRECLPMDEWVDTPRGPVQLRTQPDQIITVGQAEVKVAKCLFIKKRYNQICRVVTKFGSFSATKNHLILTGTGWKKIRDIIPGCDVIACPKRIPHENRGYVPHGRLLGWLIGNGYLSGTPNLVYRRELDLAVRKEVEKFGVTVRPRSTQRSRNVIEAFLSNGVESGCLLNPLMDWIRSLGLEGKTAKNKTIPWQYLGASDETHKELLRGLWEADGTVTGGVAKYATCNEVLARQVKWLLHTIGIRSRINYYDNGYAGMWEVSCSIEDNMRLEEICGNLRRFGKLSKPSPRFIDPAPEIFVRLIAELYKGKQRMQRRCNGELKQISKERMAKILNECPITTVSESPYMTMSEIGWTTIKSVTLQDKEVCVCDLQVPGTHNFLTNGLVVHNSGDIEQVADLVLFLFRDEVYREDSPDQGMAEIRLAKQRNGPVGKIKASYRKEIMLFGNWTAQQPGY
jgi:replicative DNA helicase